MAILDTLKGLLGYSGQLKIGEVTVDASVSEVHSLEGDVTEHSVEEGSDIADNYRVKPRGIQITGIISDTPLAVGFPLETLIGSISSAISGATPSKTAWDQIQDYFDKSEVIDISTSLQSYPNMVLTSFAATRNAQNGQNLNFTATAKRLRIVTTATVDAITIPATPEGAGGSNSKGKVPGKAAEAGKSQSMLSKIANYF